MTSHTPEKSPDTARRILLGVLSLALIASVALTIYAVQNPKDSTPRVIVPPQIRPPTDTAVLTDERGVPDQTYQVASYVMAVDAAKLGELGDQINQASDYVKGVIYQEAMAREEQERQAALAAAEASRANAPRPSSQASSGSHVSPGETARGPLTQAQLDALAQCESGGQNGWRTGYFGLEDGTNNVGSRSYESQVAQVQQIYSQYGRSAWGCADRAGLP